MVRNVLPATATSYTADPPGTGPRRASRCGQPRVLCQLTEATAKLVKAAVQIRRVQSQDVPEVLEHVARVLEEFGLQFGSGSATDDALRNLPLSYDDFGGAFWIARGDRGELLGTCGVIPVDEQRFELRKMYLDPRARGHGLGAQLLALAVEWATLHGGQRLVLDTTEAMSAAIAFYERNGFVRDDSEIRGSRCTRGYTMRLPPARG